MKTTHIENNLALEQVKLSDRQIVSNKYDSLGRMKVPNSRALIPTRAQSSWISNGEISKQTQF